MSLVEKYLDGLKTKLSEEDLESLSYTTGASAQQIEAVLQKFPDCPASLIELLKHINGTYWEKYGKHTVSVLILGSDVEEYPYYLKSTHQILTDNLMSGSIRERYADWFDNEPDLVGKGVDPDIDMQLWLCFSDCMNNGGTSSLFIDFNPAPGGVHGQVVRYLHDPDSFEVIAPDFDTYLQQLIDDEYAFVLEEDYDDEE